MKKRLHFLFGLSLLGLLLVGCNSGGSQSAPATSSSRTSTSSSSSSSNSSSSSYSSSSSSSPSSYSSSSISFSSQHEHTFSDEWSYDENGHWHAATCEHTDLKQDYAAHSMTEWEPNDQGVEERRCQVCPYKETRTIEEKFSEILKFELNDDGNTYKVSQHYGYEHYQEIFVPEKYEGKNITVIGEQAFYGCDKLVTIHLPATITEIQNQAFYNCYALATINLPAALKTIGDQAFYSCNYLSEIDLSHVDTIGMGAFQLTYALKYVDITNVKEVGNYAFGNCYVCHLKFNLATKFGDNPFGYTKCLSKIDYVGSPEEGKTVDDYYQEIFSEYSPYVNAFRVRYDETGKYLFAQFKENGPQGSYINRTVLVGYMGDDEELVIPNGFTIESASYSLNEIGDNCFSYVQSIKKVKFSNSIAVIGKNAFFRAQNLEEIEFPSTQSTNVKVSIGQYAFGETKLKEVTLTDNIVSVDDRAFAVNSLEKVTLGNGLEFLGAGAFPYRNLGAVVDDYGVAYFGTDSNPNYIAAYCDSYTGSTSYTVKDGCIIICDDLLRGLGNNLTSVALPEGLKRLGEYAFYDSFVKEVTFPSTLKSIGEYCFNSDVEASFKTGGDITKYLNIDIDFRDRENFNAIHLLDANNQAITNLVIPDSYDGEIPISCFVKAIDLKHVTIGNGATIVGARSFKDCKNLFTIIIGDSVKSIGSFTFYGCDKLVRVTLGKGLETIYDSAFSNDNLREVINHSSLSITRSNGNGGVGEKAFHITNKDSEAEVIIDETTGFAKWDHHDESFDTDEVRAFMYLGEQEDVTIPEGYTELYETFEYNKEIKSVTLSSTVKRIFAHTFSQCENLETVIVNDGVEFLGAQSFNNLKKITSLTLPKSIKTCGQGVITNCPNLTDVYYQGTIEEFKAISWAYSYNGEELEKMDYDLFLSSGQNGITTIHCTNGDLSA